MSLINCMVFDYNLIIIISNGPGLAMTQSYKLISHILRLTYPLQCPLLPCTLVRCILRGPGGGGSEVDFHFFVVASYRGEWRLPGTFGTFFGIKNIIPSQIYRDFPTIFVKSLLLLQFLKYSLETWLSCSRDYNETSSGPEFSFRPQK